MRSLLPFLFSLSRKALSLGITGRAWREAGSTLGRRILSWEPEVLGELRFIDGSHSREGTRSVLG